MRGPAINRGRSQEPGREDSQRGLLGQGPKGGGEGGARDPQGL